MRRFHNHPPSTAASHAVRWLAIGFVGLAAACEMPDSADQTEAAQDSEAIAEAELSRAGPRRGAQAYFLAVHNEPYHKAGGRQLIADRYRVLRGMVQAANARRMKLTLMFSAQWVDYIVQSEQRTAEVVRWKARGHEIAAHHHSIFHGSWDGFTDFSAREVREARAAVGKDPEPYLGTLDDFVSRLSALDPSIRSACANDETTKAALPQTIVYDTCSGYANHGPVGTTEGDRDPDKAINDYVLVGAWNGVTRKWLAHYQITTSARVAEGQRVFDSMRRGVFGGVVHSTTDQAAALVEFMDFLAERDPTGRGSKTVGQIIDSGVLPERSLPPDALE